MIARTPWAIRMGRVNMVKFVGILAVAEEVELRNSVLGDYAWFCLYARGMRTSWIRRVLVSQMPTRGSTTNSRAIQMRK